MAIDKTAAQAELLHNRLIKRFRHLKKWARRTGTNAFRLYDRDIPEIPLVLDFYNDAVSGSLYRRPYEKDPREEEIWLLAMKAEASRALDIDENRIFLKERRRMRDRQSSAGRSGQNHSSVNQYTKMQEQHFYRDIKEGELTFRVNLSDYLDTGLFLDARKKRALICSEATGKSVLNLFAYTCSMSAAAAIGSALSVDSVDLSKTYLDWGQINFALNGLDNRENYNFIRSDVFKFLTHATEKKLHWDIVILDPPSFSNSKRMNGTLDIKQDYRELIRQCLSLLNPGGKLWFSSNAKGFRLDSGDFHDYAIKDMGKELEDEDFRGKRMPVCYTFAK